jgi:hypothetical protein
VAEVARFDGVFEVALIDTASTVSGSSSSWSTRRPTLWAERAGKVQASRHSAWAGRFLGTEPDGSRSLCIDVLGAGERLRRAHAAIATGADRYAFLR